MTDLGKGCFIVTAVLSNVCLLHSCDLLRFHVQQEAHIQILHKTPTSYKEQNQTVQTLKYRLECL